ncbi:TPA: hypothetical protein O4G43_003309, partial [Vibrio alginolyticus]|nr:hypothetical protein [Vibrio alginolyticus]
FSILKVFVIISITYAFIEIFLLDYVKQLIFTLYKREHRENLYNVATTFFGTSYYSGYVYFSIFTLFLTRLELDKNKSTIFVTIASLLLVFLSQSKMLILAVLLAILIYGYLSNSKAFKVIVTIMLFSILLLLLNLESFFNYVEKYDLGFFRSLKTLLMYSSESNTLNFRIEQIEYATSLVFNSNVITGVGLAQDEMLESWIALFMYRYGLIGVFSFIILCFYLSRYCLVAMNADKNNVRLLSKSIFIWVMLLPVSQLSSAMIETSKMSYLSSFFFALLTITYDRSKHE